MSKCNKPNCDCLEKAIEANGGEEIKYGYQCLYGNDADLAKQKSQPTETPAPGGATGEVPAIPADAKEGLNDQLVIPIPLDIEKWFVEKSAPYESQHPQQGMGRSIYESGAYDMYQKLQPEITQLLQDKEALRIERNESRQKWEGEQKRSEMLSAEKNHMQDAPEKISNHPDIPEDDMRKIQIAVSTWNEEIAPWMFKGMVRGYLLAIKKLPSYITRTGEETDKLAAIFEELPSLRAQLAEVTNDRDVWKGWHHTLRKKMDEALANLSVEEWISKNIPYPNHLLSSAWAEGVKDRAEADAASIAALTEYLGLVQGERDEYRAGLSEIAGAKVLPQMIAQLILKKYPKQ